MDKRIKLLIAMRDPNKAYSASELAAALEMKYVHSVYVHIRSLLSDNLIARAEEGYIINTSNKKVQIILFLTGLFGKDAEVLFTTHTKNILQRFSTNPILKTRDLPHYNLRTVKKIAQKTKIIYSVERGHKTSYLIRTWEEPTRKLLEYFEIELKFDEDEYKHTVIKHFSAFTSQQARFKDENALKLAELNAQTYLEGRDFILDKLTNTALPELALLDVLTRQKNSRQINPFEIIRRTVDWKIKYVYNTDKIEGNPLTMEEVRTILTVGTEMLVQKKEVFETINSRTALDNIFDTTNELTTEFIKKLHLATQQSIIPDAGQYKKEENCIVDESGTLIDTVTPPQFVEERMNSLIEWHKKNKSLHPLVQATVVHNQFAYIHPFSDGNGRVARLIFNFILVKNGYYPIIFYNDLKHQYYSALRQSKSGDIKPFLLHCSDLYRQQLELF